MAAGRIDSMTVLIVTLLAIATFIAIMYSFGNYIGRPCSSISGCNNTYCWSAFNETEKNNAYVDMITCACQSARNSEFSDYQASKEIQDRYTLLTGDRGSANDICDGTLPLIQYE